MHDFEFLKDLVIVLGAAVVVVALLSRIGLPSIAGFILTGVLAGPSAFALVSDTSQVEVLAEIGVVLLMFGIGLELSLDRLRRIWRAVLIGGALQVGLTLGVTALVARALGLAWTSAIFVGCVIAVSSTAIVLRALSARGELEAPHGRLALGILVFQDLCVVPMMLAIPLLAGEAGEGASPLVTAVTAVMVLMGVLLASRVLVPPLLSFVARTRERDLFILTVFMVCFGTAWSVSRAGVSLALGAFLAGLVVAGSEFRHQALTDLIPVREVLASLFFVSVGMLLDLPRVFAELGTILAVLCAILVGKLGLILISALAMGLPLRVGILTATALCQVGEFSFVLLEAAAPTTLLDAGVAQNLRVAVILSMLLTPMALSLGPHLVRGAGRVAWLDRLLGVPVYEEDALPHADHVVVAGYGLAGERLTGMLRERGVGYIAADLNPDNVRRARAHGSTAVVADVTQPEALEELRVGDARVMVIAINDAGAAVRAIRAARQHNAALPIVARTLYAGDVEELRRAGATEVVVAEEETAQVLVERVRTRIDAGAA